MAEIVRIDVGFRGGPGRDGAATLPEGLPGQVIGYGEDGQPVAVDPGAASLPEGTEGQVLGYGADGTPVAMDMPDVPPGEPGASAYEVWLAAGNSGTVDDYLASLIGPRGQPGSDGADGRGIVAEAYDPATGVLTLTFTDGGAYQTGDLRGPPGADGDSVTVTAFTDEAAFDAATPGPREIVVLTDA